MKKMKRKCILFKKTKRNNQKYYFDPKIFQIYSEKIAKALCSAEFETLGYKKSGGVADPIFTQRFYNRGKRSK